MLTEKVCKSFTLDKKVYEKLYLLKNYRNINLSAYVNKLLKEALADIDNNKEIK
mgnify:FL=1